MRRICDCHTDFMTEIENKNKREEYVKTLENNTVCCAIFTTEKCYSIDDIEKYKNEIELYNQRLNTDLLVSIEDIGVIESGSDLKRLCGLGPFSVTLTWNHENQYAGGALCNSGLKRKGQRAIEKFEENGIILDFSHLNRKSFFEASQIVKGPIFVSHTNIDTLFHHERNLTNKQIERVVESDGFMGITLYQKFISNKTISSKNIAKQFDFLIKNFGENNFGFGSDLFGFKNNFLPFDIKGYSDFIKIENELKILGYDNKIINKIFYKNFEKFRKKRKES